MDNKNFDTDRLILNDFSGLITPDERLVLDSWIAENTENKRYHSEQKKLWNLFTLHRQMHQIDEHKAFLNTSRKLFSSKKTDFMIWLQRVAAILLLPVLIISGAYFFSVRNQNRQYSSVYNTVETPLGMRSDLILPDGTKVWLNAGSKLSYPVIFDSKNREVRLIGEAYFEVKKDKKWRFRVIARDLDIQVTGTTFNCNAYLENDQIQTALIEGQVIVTNEKTKLFKVLSPGELATLSRKDQLLTTTKTDLEKHIAWKNGKLLFKDDKMGTVLEKLQRWYNVDFEIVDKEISDYIYTATFIDESLDQALKMLSLSAPVSYTISVRSKQENQTFTKQKIKLFRKRKYNTN